MEKKLTYFSIILRFTTALLVLFSIVLTYQVMVIRNDYTVFTNPDGPELEEE